MEDELIAITGSNGLLGTKLIERCLQSGVARPVGLSRQTCSNAFLGGFDFHQIDVTDADGMRQLLERLRPRWVIHTAAMTDVDGCERQPEAAWRVNVGGAAAVAAACAAVDAHQVHLSTEYVFDGIAGPYTEDDPVNPISVYGRSKLASEAAVLAACPSAAIARTTVLYGYAPNVRPNFATWLIGQLRAGRTARIVDDQIGSPTLADNLAEQCLALALGGAHGVYNTVGADVMDRLTFARLAAGVFGLDPSLITATTTASLAQAAARPLRAGLNMNRFRQDFPGVPIIGAQAGLEALRDQLSATEVGSARSGGEAETKLQRQE
jgi:dTDP-4-dehydrorhamnose reductase